MRHELAPIFIPIDEQSNKNLGHNIVGLKNAARWSVFVKDQNLENEKLSEELKTLIERVKREFAEAIDAGDRAVAFIAGRAISGATAGYFIGSTVALLIAYRSKRAADV